MATLALTLLPSFSPASATDLEGQAEKLGTNSWEAALQTTADDALYLLTSPLRLTQQTALIVGAVGAGIVGLSLADRPIRDALRRPQDDSLDDAAFALSRLGFAPVLFGLNVGAIVVGKEIKERSGNAKHLDSALVAAESQLLTLAFSEAIAFGTARSRPPGASDPYRFEFGRASFPSAHTSQAFAVAAVFADRYDQPVPAITYGLAGLVGVSRLILDKHWPSDVAAGAVFGWAVGNALSTRHSKPQTYLDFLLIVDPLTQRYGFRFSKEF